ncbi:hypothetical protein [Spiroplasma sp. BIUS-1]|uniref:hypothetical protein n=1 Tax=Spiroplasma sp. BIUS-1 TaxID=216964 RepID=UPI00139891DE|nr:hypothetical protein [Spiroplasma sp. BIUS-1]QHX36755.1 hypothetical protein SBIUS_v1c05020 [Spiroplasma sp. BIUS-1]
MFKILSLIGSLSLTTSSLTPVSVIGNIEVEPQLKIDISKYKNISFEMDGHYFYGANKYHPIILEEFANYLKENVHWSAQRDFFDVDYITDDFTGEEMTDDDASGSNGANIGYYTVGISSNQYGQNNGFFGKTEMAFTLEHKGHDITKDQKILAEYNVTEDNFFVEDGFDLYMHVLNEWYKATPTNPLSRFKDGMFDHVDYFLTPEGEKLTNKDLEEMGWKPGESRALTLKIRASQAGKAKGIVGSTEIVIYAYASK